MGVGGQRQAPAASPPKIKDAVLIVPEIGLAPEQVRTSGDENILLHSPSFEPRNLHHVASR